MTNKTYNLPIVDIIPFIRSKSLGRILYIFEAKDSSTLITKIITDDDTHAKPVLLRKTNDHYDALRTKQKWQHKTFKDNFKETSILRIPFINEQHKRKIKEIIEENNLLITPIFTSGQQLSQKLVKTTFSQRYCNLKKCIVNSNSCYAKNIIYEATCTTCNEIYIGETKRFLHLRAREHLSNIRNNNIQASALALHYHVVHPNTSIPDIPFTIKVLEKAHDTADRKIREAIWIRKKRPTINRDNGWDTLW